MSANMARTRGLDARHAPGAGIAIQQSDCYLLTDGSGTRAARLGAALAACVLLYALNSMCAYVFHEAAGMWLAPAGCGWLGNPACPCPL